MKTIRADVAIGASWCGTLPIKWRLPVPEIHWIICPCFQADDTLIRFYENFVQVSFTHKLQSGQALMRARLENTTHGRPPVTHRTVLITRDGRRYSKTCANLPTPPFRPPTTPIALLARHLLTWSDVMNPHESSTFCKASPTVIYTGYVP
jgi:hypothetical protein